MKKKLVFLVTAKSTLLLLLLPYIENNYRVDTTDKCFFGHSLGGYI